MRWVSLLLLLTLVAVACGGDETAETVAPSNEATTTEPTVAKTTTTTESTTTTQATTTTVAAGGGESCLVGEWEIDGQTFVEMMTSAMGEEAAGQDITVEFVGGTYTVTMASSGEFTAVRDQWAFETATPEGAFRVTIDGTDTGTWSAEGDSLLVSNIASESTVTPQAVVDGELVDLPTGTLPVTSTDVVGETSTYQCSGDELTISSPDGFMARLTRVGG